MNFFFNRMPKNWNLSGVYMAIFSLLPIRLVRWPRKIIDQQPLFLDNPVYQFFANVRWLARLWYGCDIGYHASTAAVRWGELLVSERQRGTGCHYRHTRTLWCSHQILHQRPVHSKEKLLKRLLSYTSVWISLLMTVVLLSVGVSQFREVLVIEYIYLSEAGFLIVWHRSMSNVLHSACSQKCEIGPIIWISEKQ